MDIKAQYRWYMIGVTSFVVPMGIQAILFPWLIAVQLEESAERLGLAQMAMQIPGLCLVLIGGLIADRWDARKILIVVHCLSVIPPLMLGMLIHEGLLSYYWMIGYALTMGMVTSFSQPARDSLLNRIGGDNLQRTVTVTMGITFGAQIIGFAAAGFAELLGASTLLVCQSLILLFGVIAAIMLPKSQVQAALPAGSGSVAAILDGLKVVYDSEQMRSAVLILASVGLFFGGLFMVLNPIVVRDVYDGGAREISMAFASFMVGTVFTTVALVAMGGLSNPSRGLLIALCCGGLSLTVATLGLPFYGYLLVILLWGVCGGVVMSMGRTIIQEQAPESHRARVMSVLSLANIGTMPFGAMLMGFCAGAFGALESFWVAIAGVWSVAGFVVVRTNFWNSYLPTEQKAGSTKHS